MPAARYWVQVPWGSLWLLSLKVRTPASQAGNDGFKPHRSYCGYRTMAVRQIVALLMGVRYAGAICFGRMIAEGLKALGGRYGEMVPEGFVTE